MPITCSINLSKIDKDKIVTGEKGKYLNLVLIETPKSEYGDYMVKQDSTKEERANKVQTPILGNAKIRQPKAKAAAPAANGGDDLDW